MLDSQYEHAFACERRQHSAPNGSGEAERRDHRTNQSGHHDHLQQILNRQKTRVGIDAQYSMRLKREQEEREQPNAEYGHTADIAVGE